MGFWLSTQFRHAPVAIVIVQNYRGIVWASLQGWRIWKDWPQPAVLIGAAIVIASNALINWRKRRVGSFTGARVRANF